VRFFDTPEFETTPQDKSWALAKKPKNRKTKITFFTIKMLKKAPCGALVI